MKTRRTRWQRSRWMWSTSLSMDTSGIHLHSQKCMQNTSWEQKGVPDQWKRMYRTTQNSVGQRNHRQSRSVSRTGPALSGWGELMQGFDPHIRAIVWEEKHLRPRVKQLICGSLNGMRIRQSLPQAIHNYYLPDFVIAIDMGFIFGFSFFFLIFVLLSLNAVTRRRQWHPTPVLLPGKSHGWRSLVGCSPWGR